MFDAFESWIEALDALGPLGPVAFIATISFFECIPLFPTQPLSLSGGLLFGVAAGAAYNVIGFSIASTTAFYLSRTVGRGLAEKMIAKETGEGEASGPVAAKLVEVQKTIQEGSPFQQFTAITLLRLTPIVPFSASNYVLGLSPVGYPPFIAGTVAGGTIWATVYASLGAAGRSLLKTGMNLEAVMANVGEQAGDFSEKALVAALVVLVVAVVASRLPSPVPDAKDLGKPEANVKEATTKVEAEK